MKEPWSIKSRARECAGSGRPFEDEETIHAALFPDPNSSGYLRKDFTIEAWKELTESNGDEPFSHWKTVFHAPVAEEKTEDVVKDDPETLLRRLVEEDEEHTENVRYILAVMLERQKLLRETDTQKLPSGVLRVYEHRKTGDVFIIKDPQIPLSDVDKVQNEVRQLLDPAPEPEQEVSADNQEPAPEPESTDAPVDSAESPQPGIDPDGAQSPASESSEAEEPAKNDTSEEEE
ncbi:MAG: hypothetical protein ACSHYF_09600 [Verrucomicrobiaceae bacterium]